MKNFSIKLKTKLTVFLILAIFPFCSAYAGISILSGLTEHSVTGPGQTLKKTIKVKNTTDSYQEVKFYQTDYTFFADGRNIYGKPGKSPRSNAGWISISPERTTIPPQETVYINYTIRIPDDQTMKGSYWSMIMAEEISKDSPEASGQKEGKIKFGVSAVFRYGIQIVTDIGDTGKSQMKFTNPVLSKTEDNKDILQVDIENTGETMLSPDMRAELYDSRGQQVLKIGGSKSRTYPGTSIRQRFDLGDVVPGQYKALIVGDCGGSDIFGASYNLQFK